MTGVLLVITSLVATGLLMMHAGTANAAKEGPRPGWGNGDPNHVHTGPPGGSTLPGNGYGDKNHTHTGPPGQTTLP